MSPDTPSMAWVQTQCHVSAHTLMGIWGLLRGFELEFLAEEVSIYIRRCNMYIIRQSYKQVHFLNNTRSSHKRISVPVDTFERLWQSTFPFVRGERNLCFRCAVDPQIAGFWSCQSFANLLPYAIYIAILREQLTNIPYQYLRRFKTIYSLILHRTHATSARLHDILSGCRDRERSQSSLGPVGRGVSSVYVRTAPFNRWRTAL